MSMGKIYKSKYEECATEKFFNELPSKEEALESILKPILLIYDKISIFSIRNFMYNFLEKYIFIYYK